jgi:hypothetical protein
MILSRGEGRAEQAQIDEGPAPTFEGVPAEKWAAYLSEWHQAEPSGAAALIVQALPHRLRLYPQLSKSVADAEWSLRLDGLQVGLVKASRGVLQIGSEGSDHIAADAWNGVNHGEPFLFTADEVSGAVDKIHSLVTALGGSDGPLLNHGEPEHALESAILRGAMAVEVGGLKLESIGAPDSSVARGSQIPTLWAPGTKPRYLDALLRDGRVPWAVEMKVNAGGGYGAYLRHAIGQAVLYRRYLRTTAALGPWFESLQLEQRAIRALVVYPRPSHHVRAKIARRISNLLLTAAAFDVQVAMVDLPGSHEGVAGH